MNNTEVEIEKLRSGGMSVMDIATKLDVPVKVVAEKLHEQGSIEGSKFLDSEVNKLKVISLRDSGMKQQAIADEVGLSKSAVARFLRKVTHVEWWEKHDVVASDTASTKTNKVQTDTDQGTTLDLVDDKTKRLVKDMKDGGASLKDISERTGLKYHNVRNFLLKKTYAEWWENDTPSVDNNYKGFASELNKLTAINMRDLNSAPSAVIAKRLDVTENSVDKFLSRKTYAKWWVTHDEKMKAAADVGEAAVIELLDDIESDDAVDPDGNAYVNVVQDISLTGMARVTGFALVGFIVVASLAALANYLQVL